MQVQVHVNVKVQPATLADALKLTSLQISDRSLSTRGMLRHKFRLIDRQRPGGFEDFSAFGDLERVFYKKIKERIPTPIISLISSFVVAQ